MEIRMSSLSREELNQIPAELHKAIKDMSSLWDDIENCIKYAIRLLLWGPPGTGKSSIGSLHGLNGRPLERLAITAETCWPELRGHYGIGKGQEGMVWLDGPCTRSWRTGARCVIDEINEAGGDTIPGLHMFCDDSAVARMTLPTGEVIRPADGFQVIATMNTLPNALPEALCDRFVIKREVPKPNPRILFRLPTCLRPAAAHSLFGDNPQVIKMTSRSWVELGRLMDLHGHNVRDALSIVVGPKKAKDAALAIEVSAQKCENERLAASAAKA